MLGSSFYLLATAVAFSSSVLAFPGKDKHSFQAPGDGDVRSPCPGLNALANHGYLPRDGKNITIPIMMDAALKGYNIQPEVILLAARVSLMTSTYAWDAFSLEDIRLHGNVEHDASLSRMDEALGSNWEFNEDIYTTLANSNPGVDYYNASSAGEVQRLRLEQSLRDNNATHNTLSELTIRTRESSLYLAVMGDPTTGEAPKEYVDIFFREDRLPIEEGWKRSEVPINNDLIHAIEKVILKTSQWPGPVEGQCAWVRTSPGDDLDTVGPS
ncbi:Cloroperoxidase [Cylindrobasidium torrendii FP15055 ss-10]|uniref:Cloroperoxidase n=1 Tax=Cylindrobasidium torrendii FP15055 ss-10 TaxID=1314674 RepID=A0A0D7BJ13_9AGAR|nr:Cloroperoxidase [Cylindrobasidium torrendii FP15055 ss-10]